MEGAAQRVRQKHPAVVLIGALALVTALVSTDVGGGAETTGTPQATPITRLLSLSNVVRALQSAGMTVVETGETVHQPFFSVPGRIVRVEGQNLQVFIYPSEAARAAESDTIGPDGSQIGTTIVDWVATPHFAAVGNVLTLLVSDDEVLADAVASAVASLAPTATPTASPAATVAPSDWSTPAAASDLVGTITSIHPMASAGSTGIGTILIEENPGAESGPKATVTITAETTILRHHGDAFVPATFASLREGQRVEAWFTGPVAESYPVQATAATVVVAAVP